MNVHLYKALATSVLALVALVILLGSPGFRGRKWLLAFIGLSAFAFTFSYLPILLMDFQIVLEGWLRFSQAYGHVIDFLLVLMSWITLVGFVAAQHLPGGGAPEAVRTYEKSTDGERRTVDVRVGFSWPCFLLGPIWAWSKGLVGIGLGLLAGNLVFLALATLIELLDLGYLMDSWDGRPTLPGWLFEGLLTFLILTGWLFTAELFANSWYEKSLSRRGFRPVDP